MDAKKALIITWIFIGIIVAGLIGFFIGRAHPDTGINDLNNLQGPGQGGTQVTQPSGQPSQQGSGGKITTPQPVMKK